MAGKRLIFCAAGAASLFGASLHAAIITAGPAPQLGVTTAPPPGSLGYDYPAFNQAGFVGNGLTTDLKSLPSWATVSYASGLSNGGSYSGTQYSTLTVGTTTGNPGVVFHYGPNNGATPPAPVSLADITIGAGVPAAFTLGFLEGVTDNGGENATLTISSGTSSFVANAVPTMQSKVNNYYFVTVANAAPGDVIDVAGIILVPGANANANAALGGITFDTAVVSTPEPASLGLVGAAGLLLARRKRL